MIPDESVPHFYVRMPDGSFKQTHMGINKIFIDMQGEEI